MNARKVVEVYVGIDGKTYIRVVRFDWRLHSVDGLHLLLPACGAQIAKKEDR